MTMALGDSGWTDQSLGVLQRARDHYGGAEMWRALRLIRLFPQKLSGLVPWLKGHGQTFGFRGAFEVRPRQRWARFLNYPDAEHVGIFDDGLVRIEDSVSHRTVTQSEQHRRSFRGLAMHRRWSPLDALYFFGYALTHYHSLPFSLFDARLIRAREIGSPHDRLNVLEVELPESLHSHCRRQSFYFDKVGCLVRHDYHAEIVGLLARGAHFWKRQTRFSGLPISLERHVLGRVGSIACPLTALHATFADAEVELE
ncbi:MAG TPA: hypothetical protein VER04_27600 [Polyangiaceae bacterium]|nr:hypothetical protein [Polyangiaceae bacterium]